VTGRAPPPALTGPPFPVRAFLAGVGASIAGALVLFFLVPGRHERLFAGITPWTFLVSLAAAIVLSLAVHELGHLVGGTLAGWRPTLLILGPVRVARVDGRLDVRRHGSLAWLGGGAAVALPVRWEGWRRFRRANLWMIVGGPVASGVLAATAWWAASLVRTGGASALFWTSTALVSAVVGCGTLIPMSVGGPLRSDGGQLLDVFRATLGDGTIELRALRLLAGTCRPRDWPSALVDAALCAPLRAAERADVCAYAAWAACDHGDVERADALFQAAVEAVTEETAGAAAEDHRSELAVQLALFHAVWRQDDVRAEGWMTAAGERARDEPAIALARAALLLARGDVPAARAALAAAHELRRAATLPLGGGAGHLPAVELLERRLAAAR